LSIVEVISSFHLPSPQFSKWGPTIVHSEVTPRSHNRG